MIIIYYAHVFKAGAGHNYIDSGSNHISVMTGGRTFQRVNLFNHSALFGMSTSVALLCLHHGSVQSAL